LEVFLQSKQPEPGYHSALKENENIQEILAGSTVDRKPPRALPEAIKILKFLISSIECCIDMTQEDSCLESGSLS